MNNSMKKLFLVTLLGFSNLAINAEEKSKLDLFQNKFEAYSYYSAIAKDAFSFKNSGLGVGVTYYINPYIGISSDVVGYDSFTAGNLVDRVGVSLTTRYPLTRNVAVYGQGGFGYQTEGSDLDIMLRAGLQVKVTKTFGLFSDIGQGVSFDNGAYQEIRVGASVSF